MGLSIGEENARYSKNAMALHRRLSSAAPLESVFTIEPASRLDIVNVRPRLGQLLSRFSFVLLFSAHTTAGYLPQSITDRLSNAGISTREYIRAFQRLFPEGAGYRHDNLCERSELSDAAKLTEPRNGDAHLIFVAAGLETCVVYEGRRRHPVYLIELDGTNRAARRKRLTHVIGFNNEQTLARARFNVLVRPNGYAVVNLKAKEVGLYEFARGLIADREIEYGRLRLSLAPGERAAGLVVNEYERLLVDEDLTGFFRDPCLFERRRSGSSGPIATGCNSRVFHVIGDPVQMADPQHSRWVDLGLSKSEISVPIAPTGIPARTGLLEGRYHCPMLYQWQKSPTYWRTLWLSVSRFY